MLAARRIEMPVHTGDAERGPLRRCIASGASLPITSLVRFVADPKGTIVPDICNALPGRGLWLTADRAMIEKAATKQMFTKAAKRNVTTGPNLVEQVEGLLKRRCLNHIGLARRAGLVAIGAEKVKTQIATGLTAALFEAANGSLPERQKIFSLAPHVPMVDLFTSAELGAALGRDTAVHVALLRGGLTRVLLEDVVRYAGLRRKN
ncbi:MAG TPA: RNA-binding protein [Rhodospirillaceae bacterium]|nr:RNA-binding protein [Rhodospirillaceae bacterium]